MKLILEYFKPVALGIILLIAFGDQYSKEENNMCEKSPMDKDGIVRLSKIKVNPDYLEEYKKYAMELGTVSLETESGVLTMYTVADKGNPCNITILEHTQVRRRTEVI